MLGILLVLACESNNNGKDTENDGGGRNPVADTDADSGTDSDLNMDAGRDASGGTNECDMVLQDCPSGRKCNGVRDAFDQPWQGTRCVRDNEDSGAPPEMICFNGEDGTDTCGPNTMCMQFGTGEGACFPYCGPSSEGPTCDPGYTCATLDRHVPIRLCSMECNPLAADCPYETSLFGCYPADDSFACIPWRPFGSGQYGDQCMNQTDCSHGTWCADSEQVPGCTGETGCCSTFCNTNEPNTCPGESQGQDCMPYYENGTAPPGAETVGQCIGLSTKMF